MPRAPSSSFAPFDPLASGRELTGAEQRVLSRRPFPWRAARTLFVIVALVGAITVQYLRHSARAHALAETAALERKVADAKALARAFAEAGALERDLDKQILALKIAEAKRRARAVAVHPEKRALGCGGTGARCDAGNVALGVGGPGRARGSYPD